MLAIVSPDMLTKGTGKEAVKYVKSQDTVCDVSYYNEKLRIAAAATMSTCIKEQYCRLGVAGKLKNIWG